MPFSRPTLSALRTQAKQDIAAQLPGTDPLLRFSVLGILGQMLAGMTHLHFGYLDWIAQQAVPVTATGEFLEAWAQLKGISRVPAAAASGTVTFTGTTGTVLPAGTALVRGDGWQYATNAAGTVAGGTVTVPATAAADAQGLKGAGGNCDAGTALALATGIAGIASSGVAATAFTGGADIEGDDSLRARMLAAFAAPARGGSAADYLAWALAVPGVTRAWVVPHGYGAGTVLVYTMFDAANAGTGGYPIGSAGVAAGEVRDTVATGDLLTVANAIYPAQPVTALVYAIPPSGYTVNMTITGLSGATTTVKTAISNAIKGVFLTQGTIAAGATTVLRSYIEAAIAAVPGSTGFILSAPTGNITVPAGQLPVLGTITWA